MSDRPLGIGLVCGLFGLIGVALTPYSVVLLTRVPEATAPPNQPLSVEVFLQLFPIFTLSLGVLALYVAVALWRARPRGRLGGLLWIALWLAQEVLLGLWALNGPETIREIGLDGGRAVRFVVGAAVFAYLWAVGATYVDGGAADPGSSAVSDDDE